MKFYTKIILLYQTKTSQVVSQLPPAPCYHCLSAFYAEAFEHLLESCHHLSDMVRGTVNEIQILWWMRSVVVFWLWCQEIWFGVVCISSCLAFHPMLSWGKREVNWLSWDRLFRVLPIWKHVATHSSLL